jgi:TolA-binding protein
VISLLSLSLLGQSCATGYAAPVYQAAAYQAPAYNYAAPAYHNYDVVTKFVAVAPYADHAVLAGDYFRAEKATAERLAAEQRSRDQISQLTGAVNQLREIVTVTTTTRTTADQEPQNEPLPQRGLASPQQPQYDTGQRPSFPAPPPPPSKALPPQPPIIPRRAPQLPSKTPPLPSFQQQQDAPPPPPSPAPAPAPSFPLRGGVPGSIVSATLNNRCAGCHTGQSARGGVRIFDGPGVLANLGPNEYEAIDAEVVSGRMPKNGPLSLAEYGELKTWLLSAQTPTRSDVMADRNPF